MGETIVALIPAYNEELTIGSVVLETRRYVDEVIVVDDGSSDATAEIAKLAGAIVVRNEVNGGKANALKRGFEELKGRDLSAVVLLDADGQHAPQEIPKILEPVLKGKADLVIGSRFMNSDNDIPAYRHLGQVILNVVTNMGTKQRISDSQSGFRALSVSAVRSLDFFSRGYSVESDMLIYLSEKGMRIKEVPITSRYEVPKGHKKNPFAHGLEVFARVLRIVSQKRPLLIIGVPGFIIFLTGLILGFLSLIEITLFGWGWLFQTVLAAFLFIIGMVLGITSLTLNAIAMMLAERH
ncbi:MAG: glycosyltransferase family 2 protein [Methanomassiliicoccales archaeon]|nr:glycosyltransferase family 2 protein [Methanomassiliicoccales archaeon]